MFLYGINVIIRGENMKNQNYIDKIINKWEKFNNGKNEIYLYTINNLLDILIDEKNDYIVDYDDDDDIIDYHNIIDNINYIKSLHGNYIVIDTPNDNDMICIIQFDDDNNIIGFGEMQTTYDKMYCNKCDKISILYDCMQFFRKIDNTGLLQHIYNKWNYYNRDDDIYNIPCDVLTNIIKKWVK